MKQTMIILFLSIVGGQPVGAGNKEYTNGLFILNEDWFGHNNSTISFLDPVAGTFDYDLIGNNADNGNQSLGCTAQFGTIYGDHIYLIAKQDQDPGERHATGGRLVVADAKTFKIKKRMARIAEKDGRSMADGRSFVGVDETKGYIGTSNGIYILNLTSLEITGSIADTGNPLIVGDENNSAGIGALYQNQIGTMLRTHDYVFAIQQDRGVLVINPATDRIETVIAGCFSTMTQSKDGTIWVGKNSNANYQTYPYGNHGSSGEEWEGNQLLKINPATLETRLIDLPSPVGINQTWYAWTAGSLCASAQHNRLYFTFNPDKWSWFACSLLYRYDIDDDAFVQLYDSSPEERYFYGAGVRINPLDDKLYASLYLDNISQSYFFYQMDSDGGKLREYEPIARYWFPSLFIFPDNHAPEVGKWAPVTITNTEPFTLDLSNLATDRDNLAAAITCRLVANDRPASLAAQIRSNRLTLIAQPAQTGDAHITVRFNSNGKTVDQTLTVHLDTPTAINRIEGLPSKTGVRIFNLHGQLLRSQEISGEGTITGLPAGQIYIVRIGAKAYKIRM